MHSKEKRELLVLFNTLAATLIFFLKNRLFSGAKDFFFVPTSANNNAHFIDAYAK